MNMESNLQNFVVNYLRELMTANHLTQGHIADAMQTSRQTIANYLTGRTDLTLNAFEKMAAAVGADIPKMFMNYTPGNFSPSITGNKNKTILTGRDYSHGGGSSELEIEIKYLKELVKDKDEQIKFLKTLVK